MSAPRDPPPFQGPVESVRMLRHDPWVMGPAAASYGFGTQAGSACLPQDLSTTSSSSGPHCPTLAKTNGHILSWLGAGGLCNRPVLDTQEAWASVDPAGWLPSDLAHKPGAPGGGRPDTLREGLQDQARWPWPRGPGAGSATRSTVRGRGTSLAPPAIGQNPLLPSHPGDGIG